MKRFGRSPHGERGLKFHVFFFKSPYPSSLPSRGAWIEMMLLPQQNRRERRRSPHGERGLKLLTQIYTR